MGSSREVILRSKPLGISNGGSSFARFQSLAKRLLAVPKAEADKQKSLVTKKPRSMKSG